MGKINTTTASEVKEALATETEAPTPEATPVTPVVEPPVDGEGEG